jgi:hypothetical protein
MMKCRIKGANKINNSKGLGFKIWRWRLSKFMKMFIDIYTNNLVLHNQRHTNSNKLAFYSCTKEEEKIIISSPKWRKDSKHKVINIYMIW